MPTRASGNLWREKIPSRGDTPQELRSANWQLRTAFEVEENVRYWRERWQLLILSLASMKCWLKRQGG